WDERYAVQLRQEFGLDPGATIKNLSKGQRARAGLMVALAYRPDLLVLDEPSSGLDPIVRRDILGAIIRTIAEEGRTVLFSSHLVRGEVGRVAHGVAVIRAGVIVCCDALDDIRESPCGMPLGSPAPRGGPPPLDGALAWQGAGREWTAVCSGRVGQLHAAAA